MKWITPLLSDTRIIKRFALFPMNIYSEWRWLEVVYIKQEYSWGRDLVGGDCLKWKRKKFVEKQDFLDFIENKKTKKKTIKN